MVEPETMRPSVALALLVLLAGCVATGPATTTDATQPSTSTTTATTEAPTNSQSTTTSAPHFAYENLSTESQTDFARLRSKQHIESPEPLFGPRIADRHLTTVYVTHDDTTYEIRHQRQTRESKTCLQALEPVSNDTIGDGDQVAHYGNLSTDGQRLFDRVANGTGTETNTCYDPTNYPLREPSHILHNGTYYSLVEMHGSSYVYVYWLEESVGN